MIQVIESIFMWIAYFLGFTFNLHDLQLLPQLSRPWFSRGSIGSAASTRFVSSICDGGASISCGWADLVSRCRWQMKSCWSKWLWWVSRAMIFHFQGTFDLLLRRVYRETPWSIFPCVYRKIMNRKANFRILLLTLMIHVSCIRTHRVICLYPDTIIEIRNRSLLPNDHLVFSHVPNMTQAVHASICNSNLALD